MFQKAASSRLERMAIKFPIIPHRIVGAKCRGSIVPEELETDGEKNITLRCNVLRSCDGNN
jgi:hypothetical protein